MIGRSEFGRGVLYGLRLAPREEFVSEGRSFHEAFRVMLDAAVQKGGAVGWRAAALREDFDPMFGVFPAAEDMVLEGLRDLILVLKAPALRVAQFKLSMGEASRLLERSPDAVTFRELGLCLHAAMS